MSNIIYYVTMTIWINGMYGIHSVDAECYALPYSMKEAQFQKEFNYHPSQIEHISKEDIILYPDPHWDKSSLQKYIYVVEQTKHLLKDVIDYRYPDTVFMYKNYIVKKLNLTTDNSYTGYKTSSNKKRSGECMCEQKEWEDPVSDGTR